MSTGNVKWFDKKKGYGFVVDSDEGKDIYIHYTEFVERFLPEKNDIISFEIVKGEKGLKAQKITKVG